ncbi:hypothetical protein PENTCL1PPCAC_2976, partial [Pristionchus entomophagus]
RVRIVKKVGRRGIQKNRSLNSAVSHNRIQLVKNVGRGAIQKKRSVFRRSFMKSIGVKRCPVDRSDETTPSKVIVDVVTRGNGGTYTNKLKTEEELDAELESYMKKPIIFKKNGSSFETTRTTF